MNIGDYVYLYLFDLEKFIKHMKLLRQDRFGRIVDKSILRNPNGNNVVQYKIELFFSKETIQYRSDNLSTNIIHVNELMKKIEKMDIPFYKKEALLKQINDVVKE